MHRKHSQSRFSRGFHFVVLLGVAALGGAAWVAWRVASRAQPALSLGRPFTVVGRNAQLVVQAKEPRHGVTAFRVALVQGDRRWPLVEETYAPPRPEVQWTWTPRDEKRFRLADGAGTIEAEATGAPFAVFGGRTAQLRQPFTARLVPPRLEVLTSQHYVNQGGCDMVVYKVTPAEAESGVVVGDRLFRGFPMPAAAEPGVHFAVFALPYDADPKAPVRLRARDEAGNESVVGFWQKVFPKVFRARPIPLDDAFLNKVVPEILSHTPSLADQGELLKNYLQINRDLRKANNARLAELAARSEPRFLWTKPFKQLTNSQVEAHFADHRTYLYQGREVDRQDHLGYDLATTARAPILAANDGTVVLAEYLGIYGNTVVLDHGYGLLSLYGHLSSFGVKVGDRVTLGQEIARSGATGLAGGDHLHFSMILQGEQVDAKEWWDPHWIEDRVQAKLRSFARPSPPPDPAAPRP